MSASNVPSELYVADWQLNFAYDEPLAALKADPNIDDPVNDTGISLRCGDLQLSDEFACMLTALVADGEDL
jgi:hypothetical protein